MPPKARVTKDMVIDAAFEVARQTGAENISARTVSEKLNCSTQPVMYHFATIEALKKAAYAKADRFHTEYLMNAEPHNIMLCIGLNYIRFAVEEPHLFRFLFQSGFSTKNNFLEMVNSQELVPIISAMQEAMNLNTEQTKEVFVTLALFVHGYASIITGHSLEYDEKIIRLHLERVYTGAILALQEEMKRLYEKSALSFTLACIAAYCVLQSLANPLNQIIGVQYSASAILCALQAVFLWRFIRQNSLVCGLCRPSASSRQFLYYIPLVILMTRNFWNGAAINFSLSETVCCILCMLCVGFVEEVLFRGLLFQALEKDSVNMAIIISSLTFGLGHLLNLVNGSGMELGENLLQVTGAMALGFLFVILFYRGGSLCPCIIAHAVINITSAFANEEGLTLERHIIFQVILIAVAAGYAFVLTKTLPKRARTDGRIEGDG